MNELMLGKKIFDKIAWFIGVAILACGGLTLWTIHDNPHMLDDYKLQAPIAQKTPFHILPPTPGLYSGKLALPTPTYIAPYSQPAKSK